MSSKRVLFGLTEREAKNEIKKFLMERFDWDEQGNAPEYETDIDNGEPRYDDYGEPIKRGGQGYGIDPSARNRQGYNADGTKGPWFSRSVAMATAVILNDNGTRYVLANQRGSGTPDYQGWWNLPCGYLDHNEDAMDGARREVYEETGIKLQRSQMREVSVSSDPRQNRQNVCFFFTAEINGSPSDFPFSKDNMEDNEVGGIQWVPIDRVDSVKWAFWHNRMLKELLPQIQSQGNDSGNNSQIAQAIQMLQNGSNTEDVIALLQQCLNN